MLAGCLADGSPDSDELGDDTIAEKGEADGAEDGVLKDEVPWTKVTVFAEAGQCAKGRMPHLAALSRALEGVAAGQRHGN